MKTKFTKKQWWVIAAVAATVVFFMYQLINAPKDIGPKLEYVGQKNYGCSWWQGVFTLGLCGYKDTNSSFFYATDMNESQLKSYFKNANIELQPVHDIDPPYPHISTEFRFHLGEEYATAMYHLDAQAFLTKDALDIKTDKPHIFEVNKSSYEIINKSY